MATDQEIKDLAARIAAEFRPERIILFGSHATHAARPDSDVDLLVVMPHEGSAVDKAVEILVRTDPAFPIDLLVRSPDEVGWRYRHGDPLVRAALDSGHVLYEAAA